MFNCEPIIECQLYPGTKYIALGKDGEVEWLITERDGNKFKAISQSGKIQQMSISQFWFLMRVKRFLYFKEAVIGGSDDRFEAKNNGVVGCAGACN